MKYRKKGLIEAIAWFDGMPMVGVSVSPHDHDNGSPRDGDMIAWAPDNPDDRWLISKAYFEANYELANKPWTG